MSRFLSCKSQELELKLLGLDQPGRCNGYILGQESILVLRFHLSQAVIILPRAKTSQSVSFDKGRDDFKPLKKVVPETLEAR